MEGRAPPAAAAGGGGGSDALSDLKAQVLGMLGLSEEDVFEGGGGGGGSSKGKGDDADADADAGADLDGGDAEACHSGPGLRVRVQLDPDVVEGLPYMDLDYVRGHDGLSRTSDGRLLVTYDAIVYDVTEFAQHHPGGRDLLLTAAGLDLDHFFGNYAVHGLTPKAAQWLAPLAVGRLTEADALRARQLSNPEAHVERRMTLLGGARRKIVIIAATLPFWMAIRGAVRLVGWAVPPLGRLLAWALPVAVPGWSPGAEPLPPAAAVQDGNGGGNGNDGGERGTVAVIGGGIAGCGAAWALQREGFAVTLYEARGQISGNARTFEWDFSPYRPDPAVDGDPTVKSCVSVTAWPPDFYKNYTCLLSTLGIETVHQPLSWFLNSKVPGAEGTLWAADPTIYDGSLRKVFAADFARYEAVVRFSRRVTNFFTLRWAPWRRNDTVSMYDTHQGLGLMNPLTVVPLYALFRAVGGTDLWWDVIFTPHYTASFLVDELRPFPAVFGPLIEAQIPLLPDQTNTWRGRSKRSEADCNITTCVTWKDAGKGIRQVFDLLVRGVDLREGVRIREVEVLPNGKKRVHDENDGHVDVDRVVFACPANAVGNIYKKHGALEDAILSTPVYADDHHPSSGHMHAVMHSDGSVIDEKHREVCLARASNYVEITRKEDGEINIENQYNFGVQTPGPGIYDLPLDKKPVMLISHALGEGKSIDPNLVRGTGNHARAHPLYSGWNVAAQLSLRLVQGKQGIYYCSNWTTPGNCHDMSLLSGLVCAHAIGAKYPFEGDVEAKKDFNRLRDLMGF
jgi:predicted NAD/FAD-binding protein/cytochrome b involved in lipid metabolism